MNLDSKPVHGSVWVGVGVVILLLAGAIVLQRQPSRIAPEPPLPVLLSVGAFALTNQSGDLVSMDSLRSKIWVANIIFTRCPGPCFRLSRQFQEAQTLIPTNAPVHFISLTADPNYDTPAVLREYAKKFNADPHRWWFLTGPKTNVYEFAVDQLKLVLLEQDATGNAPDSDSIVHSEKFVVVDGSGRVRAYVDGGEPETPARIAEAVQRLVGHPTGP